MTQFLSFHIHQLEIMLSINLIVNHRIHMKKVSQFTKLCILKRRRTRRKCSIPDVIRQCTYSRKRERELHFIDSKR